MISATTKVKQAQSYLNIKDLKVSMKQFASSYTNKCEISCMDKIKTKAPSKCVNSLTHGNIC